MLTYFFYTFGKRRYSTLQCFKKYHSTSIIGEVMLWWGQKVKLEKTAIKVLRFVLVDQESSH